MVVKRTKTQKPNTGKCILNPSSASSSKAIHAQEKRMKKLKHTDNGDEISKDKKRIIETHKLHIRKAENLNSYQRELYDLCKLIWNENVVKEQDKEERTSSFVLDCYVKDIMKDHGGRMDKNGLRERLFGCIEASAKQGLKEKWFKLLMAELDFEIKRSALLVDHLRYALEAFESAI